MRPGPSRHRGLATRWISQARLLRRLAGRLRLNSFRRLGRANEKVRTASESPIPGRSAPSNAHYTTIPRNNVV